MRTRSMLLTLLACAWVAACSEPPAPAETPTAQPPETRRDPWDEARARGVAFRAIGQEPGWVLEIDGEKMRVLYDYAQSEATAPLPQSVRAGGVTTWDSSTETRRLRAVAEEKPCADAMSGEAFPLTVTVVIDDRSLHGCGRRLAEEGASGAP